MKLCRLLFATAFTLVLAANTHAQDLQYRMVMHMTTPNMPTAGATMPTPSMTFYFKGSIVRIDTDMGAQQQGMPNMTSTIITDLAAHKSIVLMPGEKTYLEFTRAQLPDVDSAKSPKLPKFNPVVRETGETREFGGYPAKRILLSADFPVPNLPNTEIKEGNKLVMVTDNWLSTNPKLADAYKAVETALNSRGYDPMRSLLNENLRGFPVHATVMLVQVPKDKPYNADALLKAGEKAEGLMMLVVTDAQEIKLGTLDPALFTIPKGYTKQELPR